MSGGDVVHGTFRHWLRLGDDDPELVVEAIARWQNFHDELRAGLLGALERVADERSGGAGAQWAGKVRQLCAEVRATGMSTRLAAALPQAVRGMLDAEEVGRYSREQARRRMNKPLKDPSDTNMYERMRRRLAVLEADKHPSPTATVAAEFGVSRKTVQRARRKAPAR